MGGAASKNAINSAQANSLPVSSPLPVREQPPIEGETDHTLAQKLGSSQVETSTFQSSHTSVASTKEITLTAELRHVFPVPYGPSASRAKGKGPRLSLLLGKERTRVEPSRDSSPCTLSPGPTAIRGCPSSPLPKVKKAYQRASPLSSSSRFASLIHASRSCSYPGEFVPVGSVEHKHIPFASSSWSEEASSLRGKQSPSPCPCPLVVGVCEEKQKDRTSVAYGLSSIDSTAAGDCSSACHTVCAVVPYAEDERALHVRSDSIFASGGGNALSVQIRPNTAYRGACSPSGTVTHAHIQLVDNASPNLNLNVPSSSILGLTHSSVPHLEEQQGHPQLSSSISPSLGTSLHPQNRAPHNSPLVALGGVESLPYFPTIADASLRAFPSSAAARVLGMSASGSRKLRVVCDMSSDDENDAEYAHLTQTQKEDARRALHVCRYTERQSTREGSIAMAKREAKRRNHANACARMSDSAEQRTYAGAVALTWPRRSRRCSFSASSGVAESEAEGKMHGNGDGDTSSSCSEESDLIFSDDDSPCVRACTRVSESSPRRGTYLRGFDMDVETGVSVFLSPPPAL